MTFEQFTELLSDQAEGDMIFVAGAVLAPAELATAVHDRADEIRTMAVHRPGALHQPALN